MERFEEGWWLHLASDMVVIEINANKNIERRRQALSLLPDRLEIAPLNDAIWSRAMECRKLGFKPADAIHVAATEKMRADVLLTCDDRMLRTGVRNQVRLRIRIANPLSWLEEQDNDSNA